MYMIFLCYAITVWFHGQGNGKVPITCSVTATLEKNNTALDATLIDKRPLPSYDVGVDNNNFTPISYEEVIKILEQMPRSH